MHSPPVGVCFPSLCDTGLQLSYFDNVMKKNIGWRTGLKPGWHLFLPCVLLIRWFSRVSTFFWKMFFNCTRNLLLVEEKKKWWLKSKFKLYPRSFPPQPFYRFWWKFFHTLYFTYMYELNVCVLFRFPSDKQNFLMSMGLIVIVMASLSFWIVIICVLFLFFLAIWLEVYQCYLFKEPALIL